MEKSIPNYYLHQLNFSMWRTMIGILIGIAAACFKIIEPQLCILIGGTIGAAWAHYRVFRAPCDLTDWQIATLAHVITPFHLELIEPDSYDVTLGNEFHQILPDGSTKTIQSDEIVIAPGECWLAHTQEVFKFPNDLKGTLQGKSSWARLSLFVECAGLFDKGFEGTAVLELHNSGTWGILLKKGDRIAQMSFHRTLSACAPYGHHLRSSHYQGQEGAQNSWLTKIDRVVPACVAIKTS